MKTAVAIFVLIVCIICWSSCSKQHDALDAKQLIVGQWEGISRISKYTFTINGTEQYWRDTSICNKQDVYFKIDVKPDSIITEASRLYRNWGQLILKARSYTVNNHTLSYVHNPFTTFEGLSVNESSSEISMLTKNQLVLHDIDTLSPSPIEVREVWFNFVR